MKAFSTFLGIAFGLGLLAALVAGGWFLVRYVGGLFGTLEPTLATVAVIASGVALLCAAIIAGGLRAGPHRAIDSAGNGDRAKMYQGLLSLSTRHLRSRERSGELGRDSERVDLERLLVLQGAPQVITTYMRLREQCRQDGRLSDEMLMLLNTLVSEMRRDLGATALNLKRDDLLDLLLGPD